MYLWRRKATASHGAGQGARHDGDGGVVPTGCRTTALHFSVQSPFPGTTAAERERREGAVGEPEPPRALHQAEIQGCPGLLNASMGGLQVDVQADVMQMQQAVCKPDDASRFKI
ncbi:hypothetical protein ZWY2020_027038 [Hordeum vulgare]|nr:hypothetical protein ZWY2020_027038 [Hordeum vulgare]